MNICRHIYRYIYRFMCTFVYICRYSTYTHTHMCVYDRSDFPLSQRPIRFPIGDQLFY